MPTRCRLSTRSSCTSSVSRQAICHSLSLSAHTLSCVTQERLDRTCSCASNKLQADTRHLLGANIIIHTHPLNGPLSWTTRVSRYKAFHRCHLSFFLHFFLPYLLPYLSFPLTIDPLHFLAGCRHRLDPALVFCVIVVLFC